ncbi:MAG TPA: 50S ribosomal protein L11 methyltransferase [Hyphomicrobiales bacterium]|nr:50S ribosomal protein L11 methyltransferase [Hyphomicrobiales bacterium]
MPTAALRIVAPLAEIERLAALAEAALPDVPVGLNDLNDGRWTLDLFGPPGGAPERLVAAVRAAFGAALDGHAVETRVIADADWVAQSLAGLDPVRAGRFFVHGVHDRLRVPTNAIGIQVEAALAFGTGHHGTTKGCLLAFERLLRRQRPRLVLDVGTGTGVLAIAAAKALTRPVLASDIDPVAVHIARENAALNRVAHRVRAVEAIGVRHPAIASGAPYDLVFANILAGPLIALAPMLAPLVAPAGRLILSGLLARQEREVRAAYRARGLVLRSRILIDEWATLTLACPSWPGSSRRSTTS